MEGQSPHYTFQQTNSDGLVCLLEQQTLSI